MIDKGATKIPKLTGDELISMCNEAQENSLQRNKMDGEFSSPIVIDEA
ncbi:hypothetical protein L1D61_27135 [Vibrio mediterranei]|nr:hypothetical protein [Vibrio mediterranei]MCG9790793.1 hypothetical protein [Vibrio mediterranei]